MTLAPMEVENKKWKNRNV